MTVESSTTPETKELIVDFMKTHHSGTLATSDIAGNPYASVVYYGFNDDLTVCFATKSETQKYKNIEENKNVAFVIYDEVAQLSMQISGTVKIVQDEDTRRDIIRTMFQKSAQISKRELPPAEKLYAGEYVALKLTPTVMRMAVYARPDSQGDDLYETLLFSK